MPENLFQEMGEGSSHDKGFTVRMSDRKTAFVHFMAQAMRFGLVGVINTLIGVSVIYGMMYLVKASPVLANLAGHSIALCVSFFLNSWFTFEQRPTRGHAIGFLGIFGVSYLVNLGVLLLGGVAGLDPAIAQLPAMVSYTIVFFLISRYVVFR